MIKRTSRGLSLTCLVSVVALLPCIEGCGPPDLTRKRLRALIVEHKLPRPVESFSYSLDSPSRVRRLRACADAGLITVERKGAGLSIRVTPRGSEYISGVGETNERDTLRYTLRFHTPVTSQLLDITATRDYGPKQKQVGYTWKYDCPPILEGCTTLTNETQSGSATFFAWGSKWKVQ
jgi:hypothetical protein